MNTNIFYPDHPRVTQQLGEIGSHTHLRTTYPYAGFILDHVNHFKLVAIINGKAKAIICSRTENKDLFYAIPGSFSRGGMITEVGLKIQKIPKSHRVTTHVVRYNDQTSFLTAFNDKVSEARTHDVKEARTVPSAKNYNWPFVGINGIVTDNYYFTFEFNFAPESKRINETAVQELPSFFFLNLRGRQP